MLRAIAGMLLFVLAGCVSAPRATITAQRPDGEPVARSAEPEVDHFGLAARCLDEGDTVGAIPHLTAHLQAHPNALVIRALLAETHFKLGELAAAKTQFTRLTRDAATASGAVGKHLVQCHRRLGEIAATEGNSETEAFHRGVGLVLLVRQWDAEPTDAELDEITESTLVQAVAALNDAKVRLKADPRVFVYLGESLDRLGQHSAAKLARQQARDLLPDVRLNADELRQLRVAE